ncbi:hypothetical protein GOP47_0015676 [Adiantum capillus-veneris]|uniref:X8 domain-containing protein n=1 Tax=Adiantum capillus-veneris TaxID=13818 RepID=A0A9D4UK64_ADICA|nr:hypothetical protein GOP47_0015676 [Adiantum capillus-veneris]
MERDRIILAFWAIVVVVVGLIGGTQQQSGRYGGFGTVLDEKPPQLRHHDRLRKMGITYSRLADNLPSPKQAAQLMQQLGVGSVRILDSDPDVISALANTSLRVVVSVQNDDIPTLSGSVQAASTWFYTYVYPFFMNGTHITAVNVGNELLSGSKYIHAWMQLIPAMQNIHEVITKAGLNDQIIVSTSCATDILDTSFPPSAGSFRESITDTIMRPLMAFISDNSSALFLNVYPYRTWVSDRQKFPLEFALFHGSVKDGDLTYTSLLDAELDAVWAAMAKLGFPKLPLQISETGWPTLGNPGATPDNAATYIQGLVSKTLREEPKGTPLHPGGYIPTYIFSLFNEDKRPGPPLEQNWGLMYSNGSHVYPANLTPPETPASPPPHLALPPHPLASAPTPLPPLALPPRRAPSDESPTRKMGINYRTQGDNLPSPSQAVDLMLQLDVGSVRLFDSDRDVLTALANTSLRVIVSVKNKDIVDLADSQQAATEWFLTNIRPFYMSGTRIVGVNVGNEVLSQFNKDGIWERLVPAMQNIHTSITHAGLKDKIMVSTSCAMDIIDTFSPPSAASFREEIADSFMKPLLAFLSDNYSAFSLNVYPYRTWSIDQKNIPLQYALFNGSVQDGELIYSNLLDAQLDAVWTAMAKLGFPKLRLEITETGWPSQGDTSATPEIAATYIQELVNKILAHPPKGTPLHPGAYITAYIFSLLNEDKRPGPAIEQNWGLLYPNGSHVYSVDLSPPPPTAPTPPHALPPIPTPIAEPPPNLPHTPPQKPMRKIGVNYARLGDNLLPPYQAVELILELGVGNVRIFDSDPVALTALANTSLRVIISVKNEDIEGLAGSQKAADEWVHTKVKNFYMGGTNIIGVNVGNEILSNTTDTATWQHLVPAMKNIHHSIIQEELDGLVMVSTSCGMDILANSSLLQPSEASFREDIADSVMLPLLQFISDNSSALFLNVYPYRTWFDEQETFSLEFALFNGSGSAVKTGDFTYTSLLDLQLDAVWAAMAKLGFRKINLEITETGWPTDGGDGATPELASTYTQRLVNRVLQDPPQGTPLHPGVYTPTYIYSLFDEDRRPGLELEKHWGLLHPNGSQAYSADLTTPGPMSPTPPYATENDHGTVRKMGISYGRAADNLPHPNVAVALMKELGVGSVRIYDSDADVLTALANTTLRVIISVQNKDVRMLANSQEGADLWVQTNIQPFYTTGTNIIGVDVGDEFLSNPIFNDTWPQLVSAMQNIHTSITKSELYRGIMVSTSCAMDVLHNSSYNPPSAATFRYDIADPVMKPLMEFLSANSFPLFLNVYPYRGWLSGNHDKASLDFALFESSATPFVDGNVIYTNALDAQLDAIWMAMDKLGFPNVELEITETGWPTQGDSPDAEASPVLASTYVQRLVDKMLADPPHGTPLHPGTYIPTYLFSLFSENQKPGPIFEQHWGILYPNGSRVYKLDLKPPPPSAPGASEGNGAHWCMANPSADGVALQGALKTICNQDQQYCKAFAGEKHPCYQPNTLIEHASFAFNQYWQDRKTRGAICDFNGTAGLTTINHSHGDCMFGYNDVAELGDSPLLPTKKYWCVAKPNIDEHIIQEALNNVCSINTKICEPVFLNKPCHAPVTVADHASYAFNAYWQANVAENSTNCDFGGAAALTTVNPSHGMCVFEGVDDNPQRSTSPAP